MVKTLSERRAIAVAAAIAGGLLGPQAFAAEAPAPSPYGTLAKGAFPTMSPADMAPLAQGLARRGTGAGLRNPTHAVASDASGSAGEAEAMTAVVFAAPAFPADRGGADETFVKERPSGPADDIIFAAPSPSTASVNDTGLKPLATTAAPAPASVAQDKKAASKNAAVADASALTPAEIAEYKRQGREQSIKGSIAATRALLEEAAAAGDAEAQYLLARTFDPVALAHDGAIGVAADPDRAAALYRSARAAGYRAPEEEARATRP